MPTKLKIYVNETLEVMYWNFGDGTNLAIKRTWFGWLYQNLYNMFTGNFEYAPRTVGILKGYTPEDMKFQGIENGRVSYLVFDKKLEEEWI
jgi:hypothetical protein